MILPEEIISSSTGNLFLYSIIFGRENCNDRSQSQILKCSSAYWLVGRELKAKMSITHIFLSYCEKSSTHTSSMLFWQKIFYGIQQIIPFLLHCYESNKKTGVISLIYSVFPLSYLIFFSFMLLLFLNV